MKNRFSRIVFYLLWLPLIPLFLAYFSTATKIQAVGPNLISNASVESLSGSLPNVPEGWVNNAWGSNTSTFSYLNSAQQGLKSISVNVSNYASGDAKWYFNPVVVKPNTKYTYSDYYKSSVNTEIMAQFTYTGGSVGYKWLKTAVASASVWKLATVDFTTPANISKVTIFHLINKNGTLTTDNFMLAETNGAVTPVPLSISITAPANNATVSGTIQLTSNVAGSNIRGVQYKINGVNIGSEVTIAPYNLSFNTASKTDGTYSLTAVLSNTAGGSTVSNPVTINIQNTVTPPPPVSSNLIPNPSLETVRPRNANLPLSWNKEKFGTHNATFSYLRTGHTGGRSLKIQLTSYTSGSSDWYFTPVTVTGSTHYKFSSYYQTNVITEANAAVTMQDGSIEYLYLGIQVPSAAWNKFEVEFITPANAKKISIYLAISDVGYIISDDYSLEVVSAPAPLARPLATLTFDDSYDSFYDYAYPLFKKYDAEGTIYITSQDLGLPGFMTKQQYIELADYGFEMGSHTVTHPDLTQISLAQAEEELKNSKTALENYLGVPVSSFASPYGLYNQSVLSLIDKYYDSHRSTDVGFNTKNGTNRLNLRAQSVVSTTPISTVLEWIDQAIADKTWLMIVYHDVKPDDGSGLAWTTTPQDLEAVLKKLHDNGVPIVTTAQALQEVTGVTPPPPPVPALGVNIVAPISNQTVAGNVSITSSVTGSNIQSVQYKLDGNNIGGTLTASPFLLNWNSTSVVNGNHSLTAVVTNSLGETSTSTPVVINVDNTVTPPPSSINLIANPSVETVSGSSSNLPDKWSTEKGGTNNAIFTYITGGHTGNKAVKVESTSFTNGSANFHFNPVTVTGGKEYEFKAFYKASDYIELDAYITYSNGTDEYMYLTTLPQSTSWTGYTHYLKMPANAATITIYLSLTSAGYLITDDYSLVQLANPVAFNRGIVTLTFDDGLASQYQQAKTILESAGMKGTFYIQTGTIGTAGRMTGAQILAMKNAGHEIGSHTINHPHLTSLPLSTVDTELSQSRTTLNGILGFNVTAFATPYGEYNDEVISRIKNLYTSHRSVDTGFNSKDRFDPYNIRVQNVNLNTPVATVNSWIDQAIAQKEWLVLVYHDIAVGGDAFSTTPANLTSEVNYIKQTGITVKTIEQALTELKSQI